MMAGTADGRVLPPYIVYKSEELWDTWCTGGPEGAKYGRTKSGWFNEKVFEDWFEKVALRYFRRLEDQESKKVLIGDNVSSHLSHYVIQRCREYRIEFVLLPPNSTHLLQPLDVYFFRILKAKWRVQLRKWKSKHKGSIPKDTFPSLLRDALAEIPLTNNENLKAAFRASGIYPFNKESVLKNLPDLESTDEKDDGEAQTSWLDSMKELFQEQRFATKTAPHQKKKLHVPAGKSVSAPGETSSEEEPENERSSAASDSEAESSTESDSASESGAESAAGANLGTESASEAESSAEADSVPELGAEPNPATSSETNDSDNESPPRPIQDVKETDFVLVNYVSETKNKKSLMQFVGVVRKKTGKKLTIDFLRCYLGRHDTFHWPPHKR
jgi:hypothetical protein